MIKIKKINNSMKKEKGFTMQDLIIACFIITLFVGIITSLITKVYSTNAKTDLMSQMAFYSIQILEDIDKRSYEEITNDLANNYHSQLSIPLGFDINIEVTNYGEEEKLKDLIKIVKLTISYEFQGERETYKVEKLKIKEI